MKKKEVKDLGNRQGTAVQQKGRARVKQILDAATALLIEEGYGQFTMRQLSERLDIRLSNLQYYFPSRTLLIQKLLERFFGGLHTANITVCCRARKYCTPASICCYRLLTKRSAARRILQNILGVMGFIS